jgi:hypothetical protein
MTIGIYHLDEIMPNQSNDGVHFSKQAHVDDWVAIYLQVLKPCCDAYAMFASLFVATTAVDLAQPHDEPQKPVEHLLIQISHCYLLVVQEIVFHPSAKGQESFRRHGRD